MSWLLDLRLIRLFTFYLTLVFILSTGLRVHQYQAIVALVRRVPGRWPRLFQLVKQHGNVFLTWGTIFPLALSLGLLLIQTVANHWIWPHADQRLTGAVLLELWPALPVVLGCATAMIAFDIYGTVRVGEVDRKMMEKYFDQAEYWLRSWTAPVVRVFTLGYVNPRKMVNQEVRKALESASDMLNNNLWWVIIQTGLRILCGLSLWGTYALEPWLRRLVHLE
jgi:hypothetical protein